MGEKKYNRYWMIFFEEPINHSQRAMIDRSPNPAETIRKLGIKIDIERTKIENKRINNIIKLLFGLTCFYYTFALLMV